MNVPLQHANHLIGLAWIEARQMCGFKAKPRGIRAAFYQVPNRQFSHF